jgi:hypothetical protein
VAQYQEQFTATPAPAAAESTADAPSTDTGEVPAALAPQPSAVHEPPSPIKDFAAKDSSERTAKPKLANAPTAPPFVTHATPSATPSEAKDVDNYIWGAMVVVAIMSLLAFSIARILIKQGKVWEKVMR